MLTTSCCGHLLDSSWWSEFLHPGKSGPGGGYWFYSGLAGAAFLGLIPASIVFFRHRNCHVKGCWRLGHPDPAHGYPACRHHHTQKRQLGIDPHA
jgi:hypothetical protein